MAKKIEILDPKAAEVIRTMILPEAKKRGMTNRAAIELFLQKNPTVKYKVYDEQPVTQEIIQPVIPHSPQIAISPVTPATQQEPTIPSMAPDYANTLAVKDVPTGQPPKTLFRKSLGQELQNIGTAGKIGAQQMVQTGVKAYRTIGSPLDVAKKALVEPEVSPNLGVDMPEEIKPTQEEIRAQENLKTEVAKRTEERYQETTPLINASNELIDELKSQYVLSPEDQKKLEDYNVKIKNLEDSHKVTFAERNSLIKDSKELNALMDEAKQNGMKLPPDKYNRATQLKTDIDSRQKALEIKGKWSEQDIKAIQDLQVARDEVRVPNDFVKMVETLPLSISGMAVTMLNPYLGALYTAYTFGGSRADETFEKAFEYERNKPENVNKTDEQIRSEISSAYGNYAATAGIIESAGEYAGNLFIGKLFEGAATPMKTGISNFLTKRISGNLAKKAIGMSVGTATTALAGGAEETITEAGQTLGGLMVEKAAGLPTDMKKAWEETKESGKIGGLAGLFMSGIGGAAVETFSPSVQNSYKKIQEGNIDKLSSSEIEGASNALINDLKSQGEVGRASDLQTSFNLIKDADKLSNEEIQKTLDQITDEPIKLETENIIKSRLETIAKAEELASENIQVKADLEVATTHPFAGLKTTQPINPQNIKTGSVAVIDASNLGLVNTTITGPGTTVLQNRFGTTGHAAGDAYLKEFGEAVKRGTEGTDIEAWLGKNSDEVKLYSPTMTTSQLNTVIEKIKSGMKPTETFEGIDKDNRKITGQVGLLRTPGAVAVREEVVDVQGRKITPFDKAMEIAGKIEKRQAVPEVPLEKPKEEPIAEPATFIGWQENGKGEQVFPLYDLNIDIPGHAKGSTVSDVTLKEAGIKIPETPKPVSRETTPLVNVEKYLSDMSDLSRPAPIGASIGQPKRGVLKTEATPAPTPEIEKRISEAHGIGKEPILNKINEKLITTKNLFTREFANLDPQKFAIPVDILRRSKNTNSFAREKAAQYIRQYTSKLNKNQYDHFSRLIWVRDLARSIDEGLYENKKLPFGFESPTQVKDYLKVLENTADANIKEAIEVRSKLFKAYAKELVDNGQLPEEALKNSDAYMRRQVLDYYRLKNAVTDVVRGEPSNLKDYKQGFQKKRTGSDMDYNTNILEADYEVLSQMAAKVIRNGFRQELKAWSKNQKDKDGWVEWSARPGSMWFETEGLGDEVVNKVFEVLDSTEDHTGMIKEIQTIVNGAIHYKGAKDKMLLPEELVKTLNSHHFMAPSDNIISVFAKGTMNAWKQWVLFNPFRAFKYNLNNMSGDLDAVIAGAPKALKYLPEAFDDLMNDWHGKESQDVKEATEDGVIGGGMTTHEIPDINKDKILKELTGEKSNLITRYFDTVKEASQFRENLLRLAAYKYFKAEIAKGKNVYGASDPKTIDQITNPQHKASKLSRELLGDYGALTEAGNFLREKLLPFYSWMEINAPRYYRIFRNAAQSGNKTQGLRAGVIAAKNIAIKAALAPALMVMVNAWNHLFFPDEERKLSEQQRRQLHLIVGKTFDGRPVTVRFQGALSDALDWFGLADVWYDIQDIKSHKKTWGEQLKEMATAPAAKLITAVRPDVKLFTEVLTKKRLYPNPFKGIPIRDMGEHILGTLGTVATFPYNMIMGKPIRPTKEWFGSAVGYTTPDPGESAYLDVRNAKYDVLDKLGFGFSGGEPKAKANALYYWRQAKLWGDTKAENKFWDEYMKLGGTYKGIAAGIINASPLAGIRVKDFDVVLESMPEESVKKIDQAYKWYLEKMLLPEQLKELNQLKEDFSDPESTLREKLKEQEIFIRAIIKESEEEGE